MMKKLFAIVLMLAMLATAAFAEGVKYEGDGFATADEAVLAYVNALNAGDYDAMQATFCIESYVENIDTEAVVARYQMCNFNMVNTVPMPNDYMRDLIETTRLGNIARTHLMLGMQFALPENPEVSQGAPVRVQDAAAFIDTFSGGEFFSWFGAIESVGFVDPASLNVDMEMVARYFERDAAMYGCDEMALRIYQFKAAGKDYLVPMQCVRYGDVWYNDCPCVPAVSAINPNGNVSMFIQPMDAL